MSPSLNNGCCQMPIFSQLIKCHLLTRIVLNIILTLCLFVLIVVIIDFNSKTYSSVVIKKDILCSNESVIYFPANVTATYCHDGHSDLIFRLGNKTSVLSIPEIQSIIFKLTSSNEFPTSERFDVKSDKTVVIDNAITLKPWSKLDVNFFVNALRKLAHM